MERWWSWSAGLASCSVPLPIPISIPQRQAAVGVRVRVRVRCNAQGGGEHTPTRSHSQLLLRTCKNCKSQFDPALNHPSACSFHTAHFGGETKRKFESVYTGGTMNTPDSGQVYQYWHCCASDDPFHPGCTSAPHASYDD